MKYYIYSTIVILIICSQFIFSSSDIKITTLVGLIMDKQTKEPIKSSMIIFKISGRNRILFSKDDGSFQLRIPLSKAKIEIYSAGYKSHIEQFDINDTSVVRKYYYLERPGDSNLPIVVTADKIKKESIIADQIVNNILDLADDTEVPEVVQDMPSIVMSYDKHGFGKRRVPRGPEGNSVSLIDGIRLFNPIERLFSHRGASTFDFFMLDGIDSYNGPEKMVYAGDATNGVRNFKPQTPEFADEKLKQKYRSRGNYSTMNKGYNLHQDFSLASTSMGAVGGVSYGNSGSVRASNHAPAEKRIQWGSSFAFTAFNAGFGAKLSKDAQIIGAVQYHRTFGAGEAQNPNVSYPLLDRMMAYSKLLLTNFAFTDELNLTLSFQKQRSERNEQFQNGLSENKNSIDSYGFTAKAMNKIKKFQLKYGFDSYYELLNSTTLSNSYDTNVTMTLPRGEFQGDSTYGNYSTYFFTDYEASKVFNILGGMRLNYIKIFVPFTNGISSNMTSEQISAISDVDNNKTTFSYNFGTVWQFFPDFKHFINLEKSTEVPNMVDISSNRNLSLNVKEISNPSLATQNFYKIETGFMAEKKEKFDVNVNFMLQFVTNYVDYEFAGTQGNDILLDKINIDGIIYGVGLSFKYSLFSFLDAFTSFSYQVGKNADTGEYLSSIGSPGFDVGLMSKLPVFSKILITRLSVHSHLAQTKLSPVEKLIYNNEGNPASYDISLGFNYLLTKESSVFLRFNNLTDETVTRKNFKNSDISYGPGFTVSCGFDLTY